MTRAQHIAAQLLALLCWAVVLGMALPAAAEEVTLDQLKQKAEQASGGKQAKLYVQVARRQIEEANNDFNQGAADEGHRKIQDAYEYVSKARDVAISSGKRLKDTEIDIRKAVRRLDDISHTLAVEDSEKIKPLLEKMDRLRRDILTRMFGPQSAKPLTDEERAAAKDKKNRS